MNNEPFHVMSQEWRYFSRQKSLIHTLHLAQLPADRPGNTVLIDSTAPQSDPYGRPWKQPPIVLPPGGGGGTVTIYKTIKSPCFGCVSWDKQILAQRNMDISMSPWDDNLMQITMIPHEQGRFYCGIFGQSDVHGNPYNYQGPAGNGSIGLTIRKTPPIPSNDVVGAGTAIYMAGVFDPTHWRSTFYITSVISTAASGITMVAKDQPVVGTGNRIGAAALGHISMWMFKISER